MGRWKERIGYCGSSVDSLVRGLPRSEDVLFRKGIAGDNLDANLHDTFLRLCGGKEGRTGVVE